VKKTRLTRSLVLLAAVAAACSVVGASSAGSSSLSMADACKKGLKTINGKLWVQYCGPAKATARYLGKTVRFSSGTCLRRTQIKGNEVLAAALGRRIFRGWASGTKYFELASRLRGDGVYRKDAFIEWIVGRTHYVVVQPLKVTFKNQQRTATFSGKLQSETAAKPRVFRNRGTVTGTFSCAPLP
jgi:hypothetical protein